MNKLSAMIERYVAPMANKLARQKYVQAIQSTFLTMIPFLTVGSFALILISPAIVRRSPAIFSSPTRFLPSLPVPCHLNSAV